MCQTQCAGGLTSCNPKACVTGEARDHSRELTQRVTADPSESKVAFFNMKALVDLGDVRPGPIPV